MARTLDDIKRIKEFFSDKSKQRFRETRSYACEHSTDLRNSECVHCLAEMPQPEPPKPAPKPKPKPTIDHDAVARRARAAVNKKVAKKAAKKVAKKKR